MFRPRCPKCNHGLWLKEDRNGYPEAACSFCGWVLIGEERIQTFVENQYAKYKQTKVGCPSGLRSTLGKRV